MVIADAPRSNAIPPPPGTEQRHHGQRCDQLDQSTEIKPTQALAPTCVERRMLLPEANSPSTAPTKGPSSKPGSPKEQPDQRAQQSAPNRASAGPHPLRAQRPGDQIDRQPSCADQSECRPATMGRGGGIDPYER